MTRYALIVMLAALALVTGPAVNSHAKGLESFGTADAKLDLNFEAPKYRELGFPGWCVTYMVLRNENKRRPLYVYGWGKEGVLTALFSNAGGLEEEFTTKVSGSGTLNVDRYSCKTALDTIDFACGEWIKQEPRPPILVTVKNLSQWKKKDELMKKFLDPSRGLMNKKEAKSFNPKYDATIDLVMSVNDKNVEVKGRPCSMTFSDADKYWTMKFQTEFDIKGVDFGLTGDDAGTIRVEFYSEAFTKLPKAHQAPGTAGKDAKGKGKGKAPKPAIGDDDINLDLDL